MTERTQPDSQFVNANGLNIHYVENGQGDPVVLLHGWPTHAYLWHNQMDALSAAGYRVIAPDQPGYGYSDKPADAPYTVNYFERTLTGFLDALGVDKVTLGGHDLGGPTALMFAVRHPERLARMVVFDTTAYPDMPFVVNLQAKALVLAARLKPLGRALLSRTGIGLTLKYAGLVANRAAMDRQAIDTYYRPLAADPVAQDVLLRILASFDTGALNEIASNLGRIRCPTLLLWAANDPISPLSTAHRLAKDITGARLEVIPRCGHFSMEDQPQRVNEALIEFLGE